MSGFSKKLKIRIVTMVIVAMCVMNFSPMTAYASEPDAFTGTTMVVDNVEREAIRYSGEGPFVLELVVAGFTGELANTRFNVFFGRDGFASITATGSAVSWLGPANLSGDYYKIDNVGAENAGLYEVTPREGAVELTVAFAPSNPQSLISVNWHSSGKNKLTVMLRPGDATSRDYSVLRDFVYASMDGGLGTAGDFSIFANELDVTVDFEGNVAARRARLGGNGQFGVTALCEDRAYTGTYIEQLVGDDWNRIVKQETGSLVLGRDDAGGRIYVTRDQGGEWMLWSESMQPKKIAANDVLTNVFLVDDLTSWAGSKLIHFDEAFSALQSLANALSRAQTLGLDVSGGYTVLGQESRESLYAGSVSEIRVEEGNGKDKITILCKAGRNNVVALPAALLDNDRSFISFVGEDGAKDYSVIVNVIGLDAYGSSFAFQNPYIYVDGVQISGGYSRDAGRILWNLGSYNGEVGLGKTYAGVVLAPCASVIVLETHNGSVLANHIDVRGGEIHKNTFEWIPEPKITPTPTPSETPTPEDTSTPTPTGTPTPMPTPFTTETPEPTPPGEETPTPEPTETPEPTPPGEETPTPEPTETPEPTPPGEETPTPEPTGTVTPTPTETPIPTPPGENTPTPTVTPPSEITSTPEPTSTVTPEPTDTPPVTTPPADSTPTPFATPTSTPTPYNTIPTPTAVPTPTNTPTPIPTPETTPTPTPTVPLRSVEPSVSPTPSDSATSTPGGTSTPNPPDEDGTPTPDVPVPSPTPDEIIVFLDDEPPLGIPDDPSDPDEEITVFDPEELLDILDDIPLGIPEAEPEKDPEEIEIEDETPEGLPQTGVAGTGLFVAIGMAMMSFGAALGIGGRKKKDKESNEK